MDDLAGTQAPTRRMTDPAEALTALELSLPGLAALRPAAPRAVNWPVVEAGLGVVLPADYKLLCETYPPIAIGGFLGIGGPEPGCESVWVRALRDELETVAEWCEEADLAVPLRPFPTPGGLLPWAGSTQGDVFLWTTSPAGPQDWTVTVASRNSVWWHFTGGAVQFLAELVGGVLDPWALPEIRAEVAAC
jgi:hypothetical protein